jgi:hypothetical protein
MRMMIYPAAQGTKSSHRRTTGCQPWVRPAWGRGEGEMTYGDLYVAERTMHSALEETRNRAERHHLARMLSRRSERARHLACDVLAGLGRRLITWGLQLQERYSTAAQSA